MKIRNLLSILSLTSLLILSGLSGCSTPQKTAYAVVNTVVVSVDTSLKLWSDYYVHKKDALLKANDTQGLAVLYHKENQVRDAYTKYQAAAKLAIMSASLVSTNMVPSQVATEINAAGDPLVALIMSVIKN